MHMAPRLLKADGTYCLCELPSNGIIAGCTQSNLFARVLLYRAIKDSLGALPPPMQMTRSFVDDLNQICYGKKNLAYEKIKVVGLGIADELIKIKCKISAKPVILGSRQNAIRHVSAFFRRRGITVTPVIVAKDLGVGTTAGVRRTSGQLHHRIRVV